MSRRLVIAIVVALLGVTLALSGATLAEVREGAGSLEAFDPGCSQVIVNSGFETSEAWGIPVTEYTAGYSTFLMRSGVRSMRMGIVAPADNRYSYSDAYQYVQIPADATQAMLSAYLYTMSGEAPDLPLAPPPAPGMVLSAARLAGDVKYLLVLDADETIIGAPIWERTNHGQWYEYRVDLLAYAGQTIRLQFGVYNDGVNGITSMYMDDVTLEICTGPTRTPTLTATPSTTLTPSITSTQTPCVDVIANGGMETTVGGPSPTDWYARRAPRAGANSIGGIGPEWLAAMRMLPQDRCCGRGAYRAGRRPVGRWRSVPASE